MQLAPFKVSAGVSHACYPRAAVILHWLVAALLFIEIGLGWRVAGPADRAAFNVLQLHKSIGLTILALALVRLRIRRRNPVLDAGTAWERRLAATTHTGLYALLIGLPISGWLMTSAGTSGATLLYGVLPWPPVPGVAGRQDVAVVANIVHRWLTYGAYSLVALHVAGALKHQLIADDGTLARMLPGAHARFDWRLLPVLAGGALLFLAGNGAVEQALPAAVRSRLGLMPAAVPIIDPSNTAILAGLVAPILADKCYSCHGATKQNGGLRLDSIGAIMKGGANGVVVIPGKAAESELIRRILLPSGHKEAMPPAGRPGPTFAEGMLLNWWIDAGASPTMTIALGQPPANVRTILKAIGSDRSAGPFATPITPAAPASIVAARRAGFSVSSLFVNGGYLDVALLKPARPDATISAVEPLAPQLVWLDLSDAGVGDATMGAVGRLVNLDRLDLAGSRVGDEGVARLARLRKLRSLNLFGTMVGDPGLAAVARLPSLQVVFLSGSRVTAAGVAALRKTRPALRVAWIDPAAQPAPLDTGEGV